MRRPDQIKTKKQIMNTNPNSSLTNTGRFFSSGILAIALLLGLQAQPLLAGSQVPFRASFSATAESTVQFPILHSTVRGEGHALHMGASSSLATDLTVNLLTHEGQGITTLTAANGDQLVLYSEFIGAPTADVVFLEGSYVVLSGTGRFAGASGNGRLRAWHSTTGPEAEFELEGTISSPGNAKK
jgi:hypothetical protein